MTEFGRTATDNTISIQRDQVVQQLADLQARLERKGIGAAFYRAAKPDTIGDMGFMGSLLLHAMVCGPLEDLLGSSLSLDNGQLNSTLALGCIEGVSMLAEDPQERQSARRPKSAFYPLGRNNKGKIKDGKSGKAAGNYNSRFCPDVQAELAFMFELMDTLGNLEAKETDEAIDKRVHLIVRKSSNPGYQGVERRRRPRPEGLFSA